MNSTSRRSQTRENQNDARQTLSLSKRPKRIIIEESEDEESSDEDDVPLIQRKAAKSLKNPSKKLKLVSDQDPGGAQKGPANTPKEQPVKKTVSFKAPTSNNEFKAPTPIGFKAPGGFKAPSAPLTDGFKAPLAPISSNGFKAPIGRLDESMDMPSQSTDCRYAIFDCLRIN